MKKAVIVFSGGLDSTTCFAIAKSQGYECYLVSFDYNQRHAQELVAAKKIANVMGAKEHRIVAMDIGNWGGSALTDRSIDVPHRSGDEAPRDEIPVTYVPARNAIFLSAACGWAEVVGAHDIFMGANIVDYSNYPDCRPEFIRAFEKMITIATKSGSAGQAFTVHTPLLQLTKAEIIQTGTQLGVDYSLTLSCYDPDDKGLACGKCDSCRFRANGFKQAGLEDVTHYVK